MRRLLRGLGWIVLVLVLARIAAAFVWPTINDISTIATTPVFRFRDDVTVTVTRDGEGAVVNVRSHSRVGKGDLGTNARRIRRFQANLARRVS